MPYEDILDDNKKFADQLFPVLRTMSQKKFLAILNHARQKYVAVSGWRARLKQLDEAIVGVQTTPALKLNYLQVFLVVDDWNVQSSNTILMNEVVAAVDKVISKDNAYVPEQGLDMKQLRRFAVNLCREIGGDSHHDLNQKKTNYDNKTERKKRNQICIQTWPDILVASSYEQGRLLREAHPEKSVFCLSENALDHEKNSWNLTWFDALGNPVYLGMNRKINKLLKAGMPESGSIMLDKLKACCHGLLPKHANMYVFSDKDAAMAFARDYPAKHSFSLACETGRAASSSSSTPDYVWKLTWHDREGRVHPLPLSPDLAGFLKNRSELPPSDSRDGSRLKHYLLAAAQARLALINLLVHPEPNDGQKLRLTYVLQGRTLEWYDGIGNAHPVATDAYPELVEAIARTTIDAFELKNLLSHIHIRRAVDPAKRAMVNNILLRRNGVLLDVVNHLDDILPTQRIKDSYFMVPDQGTWALYHCLEDRSLERVNTASWDAFHELLFEEQAKADGPLLAERLGDALKANLRHSIRHFMALEQKKTGNCLVTNDLTGFDPHGHKAGTLVLGKMDGQWSVHYIDTLSRMLPIHWQAELGAAELLNAWSGEPEDLTCPQRLALSSSLAHCRPTAPLNQSVKTLLETTLFFKPRATEASAASSEAVVAASSASVRREEPAALRDLFFRRAQQLTTASNPALQQTPS